MGETEVTLFVGKDLLLRESKSYLAAKNLNVSGILERALSEMTVTDIVEKVAANPGGRLRYVAYDQVLRKWPRGRTPPRRLEKPEERGRVQYLDGGVLTKRYVQGDGSERMDRIFERAEKGEEPVFRVEHG